MHASERLDNLAISSSQQDEDKHKAQYISNKRKGGEEKTKGEPF